MAHGSSLLWSIDFSSSGMRAPELASSIIVVHGLSRPVASGILVP